jgi:hypothetical protein
MQELPGSFARALTKPSSNIREAESNFRLIVIAVITGELSPALNDKHICPGKLLIRFLSCHTRLFPVFIILFDTEKLRKATIYRDAMKKGPIRVKRCTTRASQGAKAH